MGLKEQMAIDARTVFLNPGDFGVEATYTAKGGQPVPVTINFRRGATLLGAGGAMIETEASCVIARSEVAEPGSGDVLRLADGETWFIDADALRGGDENSRHVALRKEPLPTFRRS